MHESLWVYLSIPVMAAAIGYVTKLLLIEMIFRPLEFRGPVEPWLGWQGQVPRNAAKMATIAIDTLEARLLRPAEILDLVDPDDVARELEEPLRRAIAEITEEIATTYEPAVWAAMPDGAKRALVRRVEAQAPATIRRLLEEVREHLDQVFNLKYTVVQTLVRDKARLVELFRGIGGNAFGFMRRAGLIFGFAIGVVQSVALLVTGQELLLPLFGLLTGGVTDFLALQMIFRPVRPGRYLGLRWQGLFHRLRPQITRDYAAMMAADILTPRAIMEGVLSGPMADRLFALIESEVHRAIDAQAPALLRPVVTVAGGPPYARLKEDATQRVIAHMTANLDLVEDYAKRRIDLQALLEERMALMTDEEYEGLLRPVFKDDEWIVVVLGAALGFLFGELQLHLLLR